MSEVEKFKCIGYMVGRSRLGGAEYVFLSDFDRVTAERDALQVLLTAADERSDVLEGLLRMSLVAMKRIYLAGEDRIIELGGDCDSAEVMMEGDPAAREIRAALKPSEGQLNQCDGCQAGIPVVNGAHRMGKPGGYPDTMSCTSKLYKP